MTKRILECAAAAALALGFPASAAPAKAADGVKQSIVVEKVEGLSDDFMMGADISMLGDIEKCGGKYYGADGKKADLFAILKENGVNWIRLRVWNNPTVNGRPYGGGNNSVDVDLPLAKRAKDAGMKLMVDFHYSDSWADPEKQNMPQDWEPYRKDIKKLSSAVEKFTAESVRRFIDAGARPDAVQIGNELNNGFMWPIGSGGKNFVALLKSAAKGVRSAQGKKGEKIKIIVHLADGGDNGLYRRVFDQLTEAKLDYDMIGLSFYTYFHGSVSALAANLKDISARYGKELCVVETAYAYTTEDSDDQGNVFKVYSDSKEGYVPSVQGQAAAVRDVIAAVASVKGGCGVFYWEPAWIPVKGAGLSASEGNTWDNQAMFDAKGRALPSLAVWKLVRGADAVKNVWGGSASNGADFVPYAMEDKLSFTVKPGEAPALPSRVKVTFTNDRESLVSVKWETRDWSAAKVGDYTVKGAIAESSFTPVAYVTVTDRINLVEDNSFESGKLGKWKLDGDDTLCFVENNKGNAHTGNWTYKYWSADGFKSTLTQTFTDIPDGTYELSLWAMGGGNDNEIRLFARDFDGTDREVSAAAVNTGWLNWQEYKVSVPVKGGKATIGIYLDAAPDCWGNFDDVVFIKAK